MTRKPRTTYTITGTLVGAYWWPIGETWTKDVQRQYTRDTAEADRAFGPDLIEDVPRLHDMGSDRPQRLRLALESLTRDGDSSEACKVAYGELSIRRDRGSRETVRRLPLSMFPSIRDYLTADVPDYASDDAEDF